MADITEEICSLKNVESHVLILRENYECSNARYMLTIFSGNMFVCSFKINGNVHPIRDIIVCPLETEDTENIDDTDTEDTE